MKLVVNPPTPCPNWQAPVSTRKHHRRPWAVPPVLISQGRLESAQSAPKKTKHRHHCVTDGRWRSNPGSNPPWVLVGVGSGSYLDRN